MRQVLLALSALVMSSVCGAQDSASTKLRNRLLHTTWVLTTDDHVGMKADSLFFTFADSNVYLRTVHVAATTGGPKVRRDSAHFPWRIVKGVGRFNDRVLLCLRFTDPGKCSPAVFYHDTSGAELFDWGTGTLRRVK